MSDFSGKTLGPYKLETPLGRGGMATVYKAFQTSVKRYVAVKVMATDIANDPGFVERFEREAQVIASLEHPHILPIIDYGTDQNVHYLVMRYIEGGSLEDRMRRKQLTLEECARLLGQMASALDYAHLRGVIHRDLKPNNVLLDGSENAYLTDFGIARLMQGDSKLTATGAVMGTPAYMSPEQGMGRPVDARSDLYTLGVVLYEMVLSRLPFAAETPAALIFKHVYETPPSAQHIAPNLPDSVSLVLDRAMQKNPDARFQSAIDMANAFAEALSHRAVTPRPETNVTGLEGGTLVGGEGLAPVQPPATKGTPAPYLGGETMPPTRPPQPAAVTSQPPPGTPPVIHAPVISSPQPQQTVQPQVVPQPEGRKLPLGLIIAAVVVVLLLIAGGVFAVISNNANGANQTGTAVAQNTAVVVAQNSTGTAVAAAQKGTAAAVALQQTSTMVAILSFTPTPSSTPTPTITPNMTETANFNELATLHAGQTQTKAVQANQTATANQEATQEAIRLLTVTAQMLSIAQTETARPSETPLPSPTSTRTPAPTKKASNTPTRTPRVTKTPESASTGPYVGLTPEDIIQKLADDGILTGTSGQFIYKRATVDVTPEVDNRTTFDLIKDNVNIVDFVISAEVVWDAPDDNNGCGFMYRYAGDDASTANFYISRVTRQGAIQTIAHDSNGFRSSPLKQGNSDLINIDDGATNQLLLIGQGDTFRLFINGQLADTITNAEFESGAVGIIGTRYAGSTSLTCHFHNLFAYELQKGLEDNLLSDTPDDIIQGLLDAGVVSGSPKKVNLSRPTGQLTTSPNTFNPLPAEAAKLTDIVISTDVTFNGADTKNLYCGVFYNGTFPQTNAIAVFFTRLKKLYVYISKDNSFKGTTPIYDGIAAPSIKDGETDRLTLVVIGGDATLYINGVQEQTWSDQTYKSGQLGYFIVNTSANDGTLECDFANTAVWSLK